MPFDPVKAVRRLTALGLSSEKLPKHIAIIMDGMVAGRSHEGSLALKGIAEACGRFGIRLRNALNSVSINSRCIAYRLKTGSAHRVNLTC